MVWQGGLAHFRYFVMIEKYSSGIGPTILVE